MQMSDEAFADYAQTLEKQDFEDDVRGLSSTLHQLVTAREDTINKLRISADYLDSIWTRYIQKSITTYCLAILITNFPVNITIDFLSCAIIKM